MRLLIIGGTVFLGRHLVSQALAAGHQVTTLNRGTQSLPEQSNVERIIADREGDLSALSGRLFDAAIDTCGYRPEIVGRSVEALKQSLGTYAFISSVSVYGDFPHLAMTEKDVIQHTPPGSPGDYGTLKADCERVVSTIMPTRALIVRPGLIVGPCDPTDRFTYWPSRIARGGTVIAPGRRDRPIQFLDVRDLAAWTLRLVEMQNRGIYIATGPEQRLTMEAFLQSCVQAIGSDSKLHWMDDDALLKLGVADWTELPLWIPDRKEAFAGFMQLNCRKAFDAGLKLRPLANTIIDTLAWDQTRDPAASRAAGMSPDREMEILRETLGPSGITPK